MILRDLKQGTPEWIQWRWEGGIGGSDVGPILLGDDWPHKDSRRDALLREEAEHAAEEERQSGIDGAFLEVHAAFALKEAEEKVLRDTQWSSRVRLPGAHSVMP